ncbi:MAG: MurR/RpiR family transcriptional regulator [Anaerolineae bacterium]|nr:MurR/RpiR family transcriptional regulator [Anaerolineae bacterium]
MFRENIRKHYEHLSRSYRRVADFILSDYRAAAFMTAAELANAVDVDTTTVVRFAQRLGYPGYPELIADIQEQVKVELSRTYTPPAEEERTPGAMVQQLISDDRTNLEKTQAYNTLDMIETVMDALHVAPRIIITGESYAAPIAASFADMLKDAGLPAVYVGGDVYERARAVPHLVRREVVIGMTPVEGPSGVASLLRFARSEGAVTVAFGPSQTSQAARAAEHLLYAPGETEGTIPSLTGLYSLCMAMAQVLAKQNAEAVAKRTAEIKRALTELS